MNFQEFILRDLVCVKCHNDIIFDIANDFTYRAHCSECDIIYIAFLSSHGWAVVFSENYSEDRCRALMN